MGGPTSFFVPYMVQAALTLENAVNLQHPSY